MREMTYTCFRIPPTILHADTYKGFRFKIVSHGTHPCAYIEIPYSHQIHKVNYSKIDIQCHGGLTYSGFDKYRSWWIGWDYAHAFDYVGSWNFQDNEEKLKQWTVREIYQQIKEVIDRYLIQKEIKIYDD